MIFIENKYTKWYYDIIKSAKNFPVTGYSEIHHIIPRCMGGSDDKENLIKFSARQHFVCHLLLTKMVNQEPYLSKLKYAFILMKHTKNYNVSSRLYENLRSNIKQSPEWIEKRTKHLKGRESPTKGMTPWNKGKPNTFEQKQKASLSLKGKTPWNYGKTWDDDHKKKLSQKMKGMDRPHMKRKVSCKYCGYENIQSVITRRHNENCKYKP